jgi:hypothetical protein
MAILEAPRMRSKLFFATLAAAAIGLTLIAGGCSERGDGAAPKVETAGNVEAGDKSQSAEFSLSAKDDDGFDLPEREEIRQKRKLTPGEEVFVVGTDDERVDTSNTYAFVIGINGKVKVETTDSDIAEVLVVRSARKREDLQRQKVEISNDECLFIRIGSAEALTPVPKVRNRLKRLAKVGARLPEASSSPESAPEIRLRVVLRLPRKANLEISGIGGDVTVGETGGHLKIAEVTGNVRVARVAGEAEIGDIDGAGHITGAVDITFAPLNVGAIRIAGVNGDIDLHFDGAVNADLSTWDVVGAIKPDFPNVEMRESEPTWGGLKARVGNGGSLIEVHDVNGNVTLSKAANRD